MNYRKATKKNAEQIVQLVQTTIKASYPKYYPKEVVEFFSEHHRESRVERDIEKGQVRILFVGDSLVGTGSCKDNEITRVFIAPEYQGQGYGSFIMQSLENEIGETYDTVYLDASLAAMQLYEERGYQATVTKQIEVSNGKALVYTRMKKQLQTLPNAGIHGITGFYCTNIFAENAKDLIDFYQTALGIPVIKTENDETNGVCFGYSMDAPMLCIWDCKKCNTAPNGTHSFVFTTDHLDEMVEDLEVRGILATKPVRYEWGTYESRLSDPDGNEVVLLERGIFMRKCIRCGTEMKENCSIKIEGAGYGIVMSSSDKLFGDRMGRPKVAICPNCGEISMYVENTEKLK